MVLVLVLQVSSLGLAQWFCLHVIDVNEVNYNTVTSRLDCVIERREYTRECNVCTKWLNV